MKQLLLNTLCLHRSSSTDIKMLLLIFPLLTFSWFPVVHLIHFPFLGLLHFLLFTLCLIPYYWFHQISHWWLWYPIFPLLSLSDFPLFHYYLISRFWPHFPYWQPPLHSKILGVCFEYVFTGFSSQNESCLIWKSLNIINELYIFSLIFCYLTRSSINIPSLIYFARNGVINALHISHLFDQILLWEIHSRKTAVHETFAT
jgi:hypothetical protein